MLFPLGSPGWWPALSHSSFFLIGYKILEVALFHFISSVSPLVKAGSISAELVGSMNHTFNLCRKKLSKHTYSMYRSHFIIFKNNLYRSIIFQIFKLLPFLCNNSLISLFAHILLCTARIKTGRNFLCYISLTSYIFYTTTGNKSGRLLTTL